MSKLVTIIVTIFVLQAMMTFGGFAPNGLGVFNLFKVFSGLDTGSGNNIYSESIAGSDANTWGTVSVGGTSYSLIGAIGVAVGLVSLTGIAVGLVGGTVQPFYFLGALSGFFLTLIGDIMAMINYLSGKALLESSHMIDPFAIIGILIYGIMAIVYLFAVIDWWRGEM